MLLAADVGRWSEVGEDIVAVNVNDLAAVGARPVGLVDCLTVAHPDPWSSVPWAGDKPRSAAADEVSWEARRPWLRTSCTNST